MHLIKIGSEIKGRVVTGFITKIVNGIHVHYLIWRGIKSGKLENVTVQSAQKAAGF